MVRQRRSEIIDTLRQRIARAIATGALCAGDRLAGTREMAHELDTDPRVVGAAYRVLEAEGLLEVRARSGVYIRADATSASRRLVPPLEMIIDVLMNAIVRGYAAPDFVSRIHTVVARRKLRVVVLATTPDQVLGIARELREDFGLDAVPLTAERLQTDAARRTMRDADFLVTTKLHRRTGEMLCTKLGIPLLIISVRTDLFEGPWSGWRDKMVHVVVLDPRFRTIVRRFLNESGVGAAVQVHLATDDLSRIPADAPTYVTQAARTYRKWAGAPGMHIPPTRILHQECVRELLQTIGTLNLAGIHE